MRPRQTRRPAALVALAAAATLLLSACSGSAGSNSSDSGGQTSFVKGTGEITTLAAAHRGAAISLSGQDLDGKTLNLADYRGKVVVVNVWGSWCSPCRAEADDFESVYKSEAAKGVQFLGIDTRDLQTTAAKAFVSDHGLTYPSLYDPDGELLLKFPNGTLNPQAIPSTLILDRQGRVAVRALTPLLADQLKKILDPVVAEKS